MVRLKGEYPNGKGGTMETGSLLLCHGITPKYLYATPVCIEGELICFDGENSSVPRGCKREDINIGIYLLASEVSMHEDKELLFDFLCSREFTNIGESTASDIIRFTNGNLFESLLDRGNNDISPSERIAHSISLRPDQVEKALRKVEHMVSFEYLFKYILSMGGDYHTASVLFSRYGTMALSAIEENPYIMMSAGMHVSLCEKIAKDKKIEHCDHRRMRYIVEYILYIHESRGDTRVEFSDICKHIHAIETTKENIKNGYETDPLFVAEEILSRRYHVQEEDGKLYVYLRENFAAEERITENVKRIQRSAYDFPEGGISIKTIEDECGYKYGNDQTKAFDCIRSSGIKIITGGPGTGKTTLLKGIIKKFRYDHPGYKIQLCAPTGCAARRMQESTGEPAMTIHKLLGIRPYEDTHSFQADELAADLLIIDESSMIDIFVMARLVSAVKNGATVLFIGDKDQLPSVSAGDVFSDLMKSEKIPVYHLNEIYRQSGRSYIVINSRKIIEGRYGLDTNNSFVIKKFSKEEDMVNEALNIVKKLKERNMTDYKVYTPSKKSKFVSGSIQMNKNIQRILHPEAENGIQYGYSRFNVGDHILFTRNNYDKGYFNGEEGCIKHIQVHFSSVHMTIDTDDGEISISGEEIDDIELGYAMTAHKSQGGECESAIILVPKSPVSMLKRQLLYVEVTRARKNVVILSEGDAIKTAISNFGEQKRQTGLADMLKRCL